MTASKTKLFTVLSLAAIFVWPSATFAQAPPPVPPDTSALAPQSDNHLRPDVRAVLQAPDPSSAIEAYARGRAVSGESADLTHAYIQRMVSFGLPEMADVQARQLLLKQPDNGLALAVQAYMAGKRGMIPQALSDIAKAVAAVPQDPFILSTAGQLIAYYDTSADQSRIPLDLRKQIERLHRSLNDKSAFTKAYTAARQMYLQAKQQQAGAPQYYQQNAPPATQSLQPQPQSSHSGDQSQLDGQPYSTYVSPTYVPPTYVYPQGTTENTYNYYYDGSSPYRYYPYYYYYRYPWYPNYYSGVSASWWWPSGAVIVNFGNNYRGYHHPYHRKNYYQDRGLNRSLYYQRYHRYPQPSWQNTPYRSQPRHTSPGYVPPRSPDVHPYHSPRYDRRSGAPRLQNPATGRMLPVPSQQQPLHRQAQQDYQHRLNEARQKLYRYYQNHQPQGVQPRPLPTLPQQSVPPGVRQGPARHAQPAAPPAARPAAPPRSSNPAPGPSRGGSHHSGGNHR